MVDACARVQQGLNHACRGRMGWIEVVKKERWDEWADAGLGELREGKGEREESAGVGWVR